MDINTVEQRAADAFLIPNNSSGRTGAFLDGIAKLATRAPVRITVACGSRENGRIYPFVQYFRYENFSEMKFWHRKKCGCFISDALLCQVQLLLPFLFIHMPFYTL